MMTNFGFGPLVNQLVNTQPPLVDDRDDFSKINQKH